MSKRQARSSGAGRRSGPSSPAEPLRRSQRTSGPPSPGNPPQVSPAARGPRTRVRPCTQTEPAAPPLQQAPTAAPATKTIVLRKIVAPATESPSVRTPRRSPRIAVSLEKENHPPGPEPTVEDLLPCHAPGSPTPLPVVPPLGAGSSSRARDVDPRDLEMSKKVRRSYSRLGGPGAGATSTPTPAARRPSCFGFEGLLTAEELPRVSPVLGSKAPETLQAPEMPWVPDTTLPGISPPLAREKRKKKKAPEILKSELDEWAAVMNAEFAAAEKFDLLIE